MAKKSKKLVSLIVLTVCIVAVLGMKVVVGMTKGKLSADAFTKVKGNKNAPLNITEFIDFQCPACAHGAMYLKEVMEKHPGLIRLTVKHFPLAMHQHGMLSAGYAECTVEQGKFWPYHDLILSRQNNWKQLEDPRPAFEQMGKELGLDLQAIQNCLEGMAVVKTIEQSKTEGQALNIRSTPTYFVNGKMFVGQKSLEQEITKYLEEHGD
ncbi:MAG: hypothetical protein A3C36_05690 [Omnitrophica WOR_2 bacterium RIFCSPHIGHO2_02_FULL_52_10]|nr:MAG: hypothetical protein A3C36_05690 [Omnitrophica WOR_2 bacterium RIFCSPHIGHO2_02_FULL_52_10]